MASKLGTIGFVGFYIVTAAEAAAINERLVGDYRRQKGGPGSASVSLEEFCGAEVKEGDTLPMIVTRVNDDGSVNGQVFLDGTGTYRIVSKLEGKNPGFWSADGETAPKVEEPAADAAQDGA